MAVLVGVADAIGFSTDWLGWGAVVVALAVVVATWGAVVVTLGAEVVTLGCVDDAAADVETDFALITGDLVDGAWVADWVETWVDTGAECVAAGVVLSGTVTTTGFWELAERASSVCDALADGTQAGSSVASMDRSGRPTEGFTAPPATVTAPADFGPSNNWNTPMMPVRMNIVMSHSCQRFAFTPTTKPPRLSPRAIPHSSHEPIAALGFTCNYGRFMVVLRYDQGLNQFLRMPAATASKRVLSSFSERPCTSSGWIRTIRSTLAFDGRRRVSQAPVPIVTQ